MRTTNFAPDRHSLEMAYARLRDKSIPLDDMLKIPALKIVLERNAKIIQSRESRFDAKAARCTNDD